MSSTMGDFLKPAGFDGPRGLRSLSREGRVVAEALRLVGRSRHDRRLRARLPYAGLERPEGLEPVLLVPGFLAGDVTLRAMSLMLRRQGYRTYRSHIHVNVGCTREAADALERRMESIVIRRGRKLSIVGHSLGGMLARGLAARRPDLVHGIVTLGSPVLAPAAVHNVLAWDAELLARLTSAGLGGLMSRDCIAGSCAQASFAETHQPLDPQVGFTAIYSRSDGVVDWKACLDPAAMAIEVSASHIGMALDPDVFDRIREALAGQRDIRANAQPESVPHLMVVSQNHR